jgi:hypothetical protein
MTNKKWEKIEKRAQRRSKAARRHHRAVAELTERLIDQIDPEIQKKMLSKLYR